MRTCFALFIATLVPAAAAPATPASWNAPGVHRILLHARSGPDLPIGAVVFKSEGGKTHYEIKLDHTRFTSYFLSMRGFECVTGEDVQCYVPYPYAHPHEISVTDLTWLEHDLLFLTKSPKEVGAKLDNGVYYQLSVTDAGLQGAPEDVDLNRIASPPDDPSTPPFAPTEREPTVRSRWITSLSIEAAVTP